MNIDDRIEPLVREALDAAVKQDATRLDAALNAFPDNEARRKGLELTVAISGVALFDMYEGKPSPDDVHDAAATIADLAQWSGLTSAEASAFLASLVDDTPLEQALGAKDAVPLIFVITATLLAASPRIRREEWWFNYLDRIEATLASPRTDR